jgi:hypothetical protein
MSLFVVFGAGAARIESEINEMLCLSGHNVENAIQLS